MIKIIEEFLENSNNSRLMRYAGALAGLSGLFLTIHDPALPDAKAALANIQVFWLVLLTFALTFLFINLVKFIWQKEKSILVVYDMPNGIFTGFVGVILLGVILNLWRYMIDVYTYIFAEFTVMIGFPALIMLGLIVLGVFIKKQKSKIPLIVVFIFNSITMGVFSGFAGYYLEVGTVKYFHLFWFSIVFPAVTVISFILLLGVAIYKKYKLFKPYPYAEPIQQIS